MRQKQLAIIGSTGSIGVQTLDIISEYPDLFRASVLVGGSNVDLLERQAVTYKPDKVVIADEKCYSRLHDTLSPLGIEVEAGEKAVAEAAISVPGIDTVVVATVGYSGLEPTLKAIEHNKQIALANKETLVVAGELVTKRLAKSRSTIMPIDSEHSAIYQSLVGESHDSIRRLLITASGGPFRNMTLEQMEHVTVKDALAHPNWSMGAKITIDSATMLNKAFEIIEARWLFDVTADKISAVVHPQSIVHSMVEFVDGSIKAQLGLPDMHLPIRYALGCAHRLPTQRPGLTIADYARLEFFEPDFERFPLLRLAYHSLEKGGNVACVINAANEIAVAAFLKGAIRFLDIRRIIEKSLETMPFIDSPTYEDYVNTNAETRKYASSLIN